jgi:hypothetical protein
MQHKNVRRVCGALFVAAALGIPGPAAAEPAGLPRELGPGFFLNLLMEIFLDGETGPPLEGVETGGGVNNGGGAMDPNGGGPKPTPPPPPPTQP